MNLLTLKQKYFKILIQRAKLYFIVSVFYQPFLSLLPIAETNTPPRISY